MGRVGLMGLGMPHTVLILCIGGELFEIETKEGRRRSEESRDGDS